jgi:site-specific DNA-methyltransferase (adenine-specific)
MSSTKPSYIIRQGDIRDLAREVGEVHCVVTSPPYYNIRQYGPSAAEVGREANVESFIQVLVDVFTSIQLHPLGSIWINIADRRINGCLQGIPSRFAQKMVNSGFLLADEVIWAKSVVREDGSTIGHCMTEPCRVRLNGNAHERVFRFVKSQKAWSDTLAVNIPRQNVPSVRYLPADLMTVETALNGRSAHNVWNVAMGQTHDKHYAVYPPSLVERPVAMSCPVFVNTDGGLPRRRVEWIDYNEGRGGSRAIGKNDPTATVAKRGRHDTGRQYIPRLPVSLGWEPIADGAIPGVVFDPFMGTGTTGAVALKMGRSFVGVDLYEEYIEIAERRCAEAMEYVDKNYGYDALYHMIMLDQGDLKARLASKRFHQVICDAAFSFEAEVA